MRVFSALMAMVVGFFTLIGTADARVDIRVDLSSQTMSVTSDSGESYVWPVSTARRGFVTPRGTYGVQSLQAMHYSRKYHNSPMPHSIFFRGGYAIHGTYASGALGRPASHGCIRLSTDHAAQLYAMVRQEGGRITISGSAPGGGKAVASHHHRHKGGHLMAKRHLPQRTTSYAPIAPSFDAWANAPSY